MPYPAIATVKARQTARAVARMTTVAMTQNLQWSSIPVMTSHSRPPARNKLAVTSICHSSIAAGRSHLRYWSRRLRRETGSIIRWRTSTRQTVDRETPGWPRRSSSKTRRRGPQLRCAARRPHITAPISALTRQGCAVGAWDRSASPSSPFSR